MKSNSYLITFKDANPLGSAFEMLKGVRDHVDAHKRTFSNFRLMNAFKVENKIQIENAIKLHNILHR